MLFIVSSGVEKVDPATRKLIRSHVMRGKKQKKTPPDKCPRLRRRIQAERLTLEGVIETCAPMIPGRVGWDLSFIEFSDEMDPSILLNMTKVSPVAMRIIFPLMMAIGFHGHHKEALYPIGLDAAALHITAFAVEEFINRILHRRGSSTNPAAMLHLQRGLRLLRGRLSGEDDELKISDSTISVVLKLASAAHFDGDYKTSKQHMNGLRRMVDLRGGLDAFRGNKNLVEMLRCDLSIALLNGGTPVFYCQPLEPVIEYPAKLLPASPDKIYFQESNQWILAMDDDLLIAWRAMRRFSMLVNLGAQTQRLMCPEIIHTTMTAVIYRLLHMGFTSGSFDETIRIGLLVFSYHIFLQWQDIKLPYDHFPTTYRNCIQGLKFADGITSQLMLWLLMIGANALFDISDEEWLRLYLREYAGICQVKTWKEMQDILKSFMWIPLLDEQPGKQLFDLLDLNKDTR